MKKQVLSFLMTLLSFTALAQSVPYAVLSDGGKTVTFYYDGNKASSGGIDINNSYISENSSSPYGTATTAVFDASFADYRPVSTAFWFHNCSSLTTINGIKNLKTDNVSDMRAMFQNCSGLKSLDVSDFKTSKVTGMSCMFNGCSSLKSLDVSGFDTSKVTEIDAMFQNCSGLTSLDVSGFNTSNVTDMSGMFNGCSNLKNLDVSGFKTTKVMYMFSLFQGCSSLTSIDVSGFNTSNVTYMYSLFQDCSSLTSLDVSGFITSNVTNMSFMFYGCSGLKSLDLSNFDTSKVTDMCLMFCSCSGLKSLDLSGFDTSKVTEMYLMFYGCSGLRRLDISGFNTSKVTEMHYMFCSCSNLKAIYSGDNWSTASVTNSDGMFYDCASLVGGNGTVYDANHTNKEYARIDKPGQPGYFTYFTQQVPEIEPIENGETIDIGNEIDENTNLDGNVVGDVYYSISSGNGSYNAAEGCIVVTKPTDDSAIDGQDIFGEDFNDHYTGIVIKVAAGKGTVKVEAQTTGDMVLKVKIGDNDPIEKKLNGKLTISVPYNVTEDSYVYIYGGTSSAGAKGMRKASGSGELKIYGIEVVGGENSLDNLTISQFDDSPVYDLNGQRVISSPSGRPGGVPMKGVFIRNGKKVLVK